MKIVITGSHFTPAQAVIAGLKKFDPKVEVVYIGRKYTREGDKTPSAESEVIPKLGIKFIPITTGRLQRRFTRYTIPSLLKIPSGVIQAMAILIQEKPDAVVSFGGYVGVPVVFCAWLLSIPVLIHEQTLVSGLANQLSSLFADKVAISFERPHRFKSAKEVLTGNPIRSEVLQPRKAGSDEIRRTIALAKDKKLPLILITGGNQGSHIINQTVAGILDKLTESGVVIHQTGESKLDDFGKLEGRRLNLQHPERYLIKKWVDGQDMGVILKNADLVVTRSGINTLLEVAYWGIPALMIPLPFVQKDEQTVNAGYFESQGLGKVLPQAKLNAASLFSVVSEMLKQSPDRGSSSDLKSVVSPDSSRRLTQEILLLIHRSRHPVV